METWETNQVATQDWIDASKNFASIVDISVIIAALGSTIQSFDCFRAGEGEDAKIARNRLKEMREHPEQLIGGAKLKARLDELLS